MNAGYRATMRCADKGSPQSTVDSSQSSIGSVDLLDERCQHPSNIFDLDQKLGEFVATDHGDLLGEFQLGAEFAGRAICDPGVSCEFLL